MRNKILSALAAASAAAGAALFYYTFTEWMPVLYFLSVTLLAAAAGLLTARFAKNKPVLRGVLAGGIFCAAFFRRDLSDK